MRSVYVSNSSLKYKVSFQVEQTSFETQVAGGGREKQANSEEKCLFLVEKQAFSAGIEKFVSGCKKSKFLAGKNCVRAEK